MEHTVYLHAMRALFPQQESQLPQTIATDQPWLDAKSGMYNLATTQLAIDALNVPLAQLCDCYVCQHYSRLYLQHLHAINEPHGVVLLAYHNYYTFISRG